MAVQHGHENMTASERLEARRSFPTPKASDGSGRGPSPGRYLSRGNLIDAVRFPTPIASDGQDRTGESGPLNPDWVEWLMGFPIGWTDLEVAEPIVLEGEPWPPEPDIPRMRRDVPRRAARLKQLGNAVVPKNAELVGWRLRELLDEVEPE